MNDGGLLAYCPDLPAAIERLRTLYARRALDSVFAVMDTPSPALEAFGAQYPAGYCACPDTNERLAFWDAHLSRKAAVHDDGVPAAYLSECDQGLYGGIVGGKVQYMADPATGWISSMVPPLLDDWSQFGAMLAPPGEPARGLAWDNPCMLTSHAFRRFLHRLDAFLKGGAGKFGVSHFILIDGLNFCFELVGATNTYLALIERPETVRNAIEFAFQLNLVVHNTFFDAGTLLAGGTCSNMVQWIPGRIVSESIDPFHMTSVDDFERWGREPVERILGCFDGGVLHVHGNGRHLLEAASSIRGIKALYLGDDRGFPRAFDILPEVRRRVGDLPLVVACGFGEFQAALDAHTLTGGALYHVCGAPNNDSANGIMDRVRAYRC